MMTARKKKWLLPVLVLLILAAACLIYVNDYYAADSAALAALENTDRVTVTLSGDRAVFTPEDPHTGLIFYPGGKVEFTAYAPLMQSLAREGVLCILLKMPANLAVLDVHAAEGIPAEYPGIAQWYLAGHSRGGSMAASHLSETKRYAGLILLASYSTADLTPLPVEVLSLYGDCDGILNKEKYQQYRDNLPEDTREVILEGANHAQFGSYGLQEGDGTGEITAQEQLTLTAGEILNFLQAA